MHALRLAFAAVASMAAVMAGPGSARAMSISPVQLEMQSTGGGSRGTLTVTNTSNAPLPVDVAIKRLTQDENGTRKYHDDAQNDFLVLPPQAMIPPGGSQVFRVQWVGEPLLAESRSFMLFANQVAVKMPGNVSGVQMISSMGAMINIAPPKSAADLTVVSAGVDIDKKTGKRQATVTVENPTKTHALLPKATLHLQAGSWQETLGPDVIGAKIGIGLVPPGQRRRFVLPVAVPQNVSSVQASIEYGVKRQ